MCTTNTDVESRARTYSEFISLNSQFEISANVIQRNQMKNKNENKNSNRNEKPNFPLHSISRRKWKHFVFRLNNDRKMIIMTELLQFSIKIFLCAMGTMNKCNGK